jgi:hypothetical protein
MRRVSWLDNLVYTFQHRWETNPRFRAAAAGGAGLVFALIICACVGVVSVATNSVLASVGAGGGGGGSGNTNTGTGKLAASTAFPTYTLPPYNYGGVPPASPIASSQTPAPIPTAVPTATSLPTAPPCVANCGGGGGSVTVTASFSPNVWHAGKPATITIHTSQPNIGIAFFWQLPGYFQPQTPYGQTDGNGDFTYQFTVASSVTAGTGQVLVYDSGNPGTPGTSISVPCAP